MFERGISVCGLGKLGTPIAAVFAASEIPVVGLDVDARKVLAINNRRAPVDEPDLQDYLELSVVRNNLSATTNPSDAVKMSDACIFVTATPSRPDGSFDHSHLMTALAAVAREVAEQHRRKFTFIIASTVTPGFCKDKAIPLLSRFVGEYDFRLAYKPEFIALGTVIRDLHFPSLLLIGEDREETGAAVMDLYNEMVFQSKRTPDRFKSDYPLSYPPVKRMSLVEAELTKISTNCAITMKISFANQVGLIAQKLGADPRKVLDAIGEDPRIGHACLRFGLPFSGPCFPRDNKMFRHVAETTGEQSPLADATDAMNKRMLRVVLERVHPHGAVGILGLAYKSGSSINECSPGEWWRQALMSRGRTVKVHDPLCEHTHTIEQVLQCATVIIACDSPEYRSITIPRDTVLIDLMGITEVEYSRTGVGK